MKTESRELLIRIAGMIEALFFGASDGAKEALGIIAENLEIVLTYESEDEK